MGELAGSDFAQDWLSQFDEAERPVAARLADAVMLVGRDELYRGLRRLLDALMAEREAADRPMALYSERKVDVAGDASEPQAREIAPFFPGAEDGRATGEGVPPVLAEDQEIGSEGAIANFVTSYERQHRGAVLNHPGPDALRDARACEIVIVTDFIGSGKRVWEMIEAFWRVATIRSWRSYHLIRFTVVAYSGTDRGIAHVRSHRVRPDVRIVHGCPTIESAFAGDELKAVMSLCRSRPRRDRYPFGFRRGGALIAFPHGMPNNAPALFHSDRSGWRPLFPNRSAIEADGEFPASNADELAASAEALLRINAARGQLDDPDTRRWIKTMLVLAAIEGGMRPASQVSAITRLPLAEVVEILGFTRVTRWTSATGALTTLGRRELVRLRQRRQRTVELPTDDQPFYYPTQLRAR